MCISLAPTCGDQSRSAGLIGIDDENCFSSEWAKFAAWRSSAQLQHLVDTLEFASDMEKVATRLELAASDVRQAAQKIPAGRQPIHHCERGEHE